MAMFHFRLKSDKKPNGAKVSAVQHVEYINREGTFAHDEHWKETNKFVGNFITTKETPNALNGLNTLLYKSDDFGSIKNSTRGIAVTENASLSIEKKHLRKEVVVSFKLIVCQNGRMTTQKIFSKRQTNTKE